MGNRRTMREQQDLAERSRRCPDFGGRRWWFSCPVSGRRCGVLYLPRGASRFASAKGHGLDYAVTRMSKLDQIWRRMARIAGRLGGEPGPQGPPPRPGRMPAATYRHQLRLWREAEERLDARANARRRRPPGQMAVPKKLDDLGRLFDTEIAFAGMTKSANFDLR